MKISYFSVFLSSLLLVGCGSSDSTTSTSNTVTQRDTQSVFPHAFSFESLTNDTTTSNAAPSRATTGTFLSNVDQLLDGTLPLKNVFTPDLLYQNPTNASCYGPTLKYNNHPDVNMTNSGELPSGDLGIWTMNNGTSTEACTAAELNARMNGVKQRVKSGLFLLASSLDALYNAGYSLPSVGAGALDITSAMPSITDVTFTSVTLEQTATNTFAYKIEFTYTKSGTPYNIKFETTHVKGSSTDTYKGLMKYQIEDSMSGGNCSSSDITKKGSLVYERVDSEQFNIDSQEADFCGHDFTTGFTSNNILDPSDRYSSSNLNGWGNNYSTFIANYKASNKSGQYSYVWQAGPDDSNSRVLQIDLNDHTPVDGESYFGFGAQVFDSNATLGENLGMICNWAGPGSTHTLQMYAQREFLTFNTTSNLFETNASGSNITYAPTNNCMYDGSGSFAYDRDLSNVIDSSDISVVKSSPSSGELAFDLWSYTGSSVAQMIENRGAHLPTKPTWP